MARSLKKGPFIEKKFLMKVIESRKTKKVVKVWKKAFMIVPEMVNSTIGVHNGKSFITIYITEEMIGRKLGEFVRTRVFKGHAGDKKSKAVKKK